MCIYVIMFLFVDELPILLQNNMYWCIFVGRKKRFQYAVFLNL